MPNARELAEEYFEMATVPPRIKALLIEAFVEGYRNGVADA